MRIYLPATLDELAALVVSAKRPAALDLAPRGAHAVTAALAAALPEEDDEGLEYSAHLAAADDTLALIAASPEIERRRLVLTVEVPDEAVVAAVGDVTVLSPSAVDIVVAVPGATIVCGHVDELEAVHDVEATLAGDDPAVERLVERDLLWYDASELPGLLLRA